VARKRTEIRERVMGILEVDINNYGMKIDVFQRMATLSATGSYI
jgi:hypothetical protein